MSNERAFTLIELIAVVVLLAILSAFFVGKFSFSNSWATDSALRELRSRLEFVVQDSFTRNINYHFEFDLDTHTYRVWELVSVDPSEAVQVDTLSGLRSKKEKIRRASQENENAGLSEAEEARNRAMREARPLDELFYQRIFNDPLGPGRRIPPLEYPSLYDPVLLPEEINLRRVLYDDRVAADERSDTIITIPISPGTLEYNELVIEFDTEKGPALISAVPFDQKVTVRYLGES
jgi:prepilin-type N-terminal cleavage/methylation domain-containing protein